MAAVLLPILLTLNNIGGRGPAYALEFGNGTGSAHANVTGLDTLAWGNVRPTATKRYWAHLVLALLVVVWVGGVIFAELRVYIKVRQDYLTSAEHRLRASATTVLVSAIPRKWLTVEALAGLYDVFPGGIRNIWINRKFDALLDKIKLRDQVFKKLESAETELVRLAKKAQIKQMEKDEKLFAKQSKQKHKTKEEKAQQQKSDDLRAQQLAQEGGVSVGDSHHVPHTVDDAIDEEEERAREQDHDNTTGHERKGGFKLPAIGGGLAAVGQGFGTVGQGLGKGLGAVGKVGGTVLGGARNVGKDLNNQIETTNGFMNFDSHQDLSDDGYDQYGRYRGEPDVGNVGGPYGAGIDKEAEKREHMVETPSPTSTGGPKLHGQEMKLPGNKVRRTIENYDTNDNAKNVGWWKFWEGPAGGFASPLPTGYEDGDEYPLTQTDGGRPSTANSGKTEKKGFFGKVKSIIPFLGEEEAETLDYPLSYNPEYKEDAHGAVWERYLRAKDRPTHRLPIFSWTPSWLPGLPIINTKVDTIYWCREQLARLNLEIEMDQKEPERFPLMNSAFIQFNHQVAAHMACQAVTHHVPKHMAPRTVEISPNDVIWDNMSIKWWEAWIRAGMVFGIVTAMVLLWTFPVGWTASLSQISSLVAKVHWLGFLKALGPKVLDAIAGVLPALVLSILLSLVPTILSYLALVQGSQTGTEKQRSVQNYYFAFLFVQVFLVVSISGGAFASLSSSTNINAIPETLATQLPKASNYFFSYMILQSLSTSAGTLLQVFTLILWYVLPKILDNTARQKWTRNTTLPSVTWGSTFPVYTNFACIALIYCVVSPLIIVFAIITFTLFWIANRYNMLYVSRFKLDTGGLLYPRALNQTFVGLYFMELCLVGLFFLVRDENGKASCITQAIIMIVSMVLTGLYQVLLNWSFGPLLLHLPITFEDEAVLRDEAFERAQARRLGIQDDEEEAISPIQHEGGIELGKINSRQNKFAKFNPANVVKEAGSWAAKSGRAIRQQTFGRGHDPNDVPKLRHVRRHRDSTLR